jgi:hypothetical protein
MFDNESPLVNLYDDEGGGGGMGDFAAAARSFVFHGLLILANSVSAARDAMEDDTRGCKADSPHLLLLSLMGSPK